MTSLADIKARLAKVSGDISHDEYRTIAVAHYEDDVRALVGEAERLTKQVEAQSLRADYWKAMNKAQAAWNEHDDEQRGRSPDLIVEAMANRAEAHDDEVAELLEKLRAMGIEP